MTLLYDHRGDPVDLRALRREHADPERSDWLSSQREEVAAILTPEHLAGLLIAADEGDALAYLTLAEEMEERELHYRAVLFQRKCGVTGAQIAVEAASDSTTHREHADLVRELTRCDAFAVLLFEMQDALGKGFSIVETIWNTDGPDGMWWPWEWKWRDPRWFHVDPHTLEVQRLVDGSPEGTPLPPFKYVRHVPRLKSGAALRSGLARPAAIAYALKRYTVQQLMRFLEVYGIPPRLGRYDPTASKEAKLELLRAVRRIGSDGAAIVPKDMPIELLERQGRSGGSEGFIGVAKFWDAQLSKVVLGQTTTTDEGASHAQVKGHNTIRVSAAAHDCRMTSATINRDVVEPFIDLNFGEQDRYPRIVVTIVEQDELAAWSKAVTSFVDRGLAVDARHVRARLGLPEPEPTAELLTPPPMGYNDPKAKAKAPTEGEE